MKHTPDEIKKGLECCSGVGRCFGECPYYNGNTNIECIRHKSADALAYIQQLERERDAAVADLAEVKDCLTCKHSANCKIGGFDCYHCNDKDCPCLTCQYEWRGVKED